MSVILGINAFHADSAACLVVEGELVAAIAEERLGSRVKHSPEFPENAIRHVLNTGGVALRDVTHVAIARDTKANRLAKISYSLRHPVRSFGAALEHFRREKLTGDLLQQLSEITGDNHADAKFQRVTVEHHLAHIASAYYASPFDSETAAFSYDASGDFCSAMAARCQGNHIEILDRVYLPHSLGFFYTAICQFIGFDQFGEEYKVMGLAPYGENRFQELMQRLVILPTAGWFKLADNYFGMHQGGKSGATHSDGQIVMGRMYTDRLIADIGAPRDRRDEITQREKDLARSCQVRFEEAAIHCLNRLHQLVPSDQLVMAGGCALNGVANSRILRDTPFSKPYLQAASSDDGTSLGAALWCYHNVANGTNRFHMKHAYWGGQATPEEIQSTLRDCPYQVTEFENEDLLNAVVELLTQGKIVGWFQGRSEWGPRALGNRSILADPTNPDMKRIINAKIKRRESFRPFAPSVLAEKVSEYFEQDVSSPFMMHVVRLRPEWQKKLPAITHVDGTGRLQSVSRDENPLYYQLIQKLGDKTGAYVILNTSFNENEPIVETPEQAYACFVRTDMDALVLKELLIIK